MIFGLFILCIALAGVAGLLFAYLAFLEVRNRQLRERLHELERLLKNYQPPAQRPHAITKIAGSAKENWPEYIENDNFP